jgi:hypothetical protein
MVAICADESIYFANLLYYIDNRRNNGAPQALFRLRPP